MKSRSYVDLEVWQRAMDLVVACYQATQAFPKSETYGLSSQLQRAAVSVPANIAEGQGRQHRQEFVQFLSIGYGSLMELETHIRIAHRLGYLQTETETQLLQKTSEVGRLLNGLRRAMRTSQPQIENQHLATEYRL